MMRIVIAAVIGLCLVCGAAVAPADLVQTIDAHFAPVNSLDITPDGTVAFTAGQDGHLKLWDTSNWELTLDVPACQAPINDVAVSPDGTFVVTAGNDGYAKVWDALTAELIVAIPAHKGAATCVAISADSLVIYTGGDDGYVRSWGVDNDYKMDFEAFAHYNGVNDLVINKAGDYLFTGGVDGYIKVYYTADMTLESTIKAFERSEVLCLALNNLEACLLAGSNNGEMRIWDASTGSLIKTVRAHAGNVNTIHVIADDKLVVSGGEDGKLKLWNRDGQLAGELQAHVLGVRDFLMTGDTLVTGGSDYKVRVWKANF